MIKRATQNKEAEAHADLKTKSEQQTALKLGA